jgi:hypothetical protein
VDGARPNDDEQAVAAADNDLGGLDTALDDRLDGIIG